MAGERMDGTTDMAIESNPEHPQKQPSSKGAPVVLEKCPKCRNWFHPDYLENHIKTFHSIKCPRCNSTIPSDQLEEHNKTCSFKKCPKCRGVKLHITGVEVQRLMEFLAV